METSLEGDILEVKYDAVSLLFKEGYLAGFIDEEGDVYEVSRSLKSVKELKSIRDIQKHLGAKVRDKKSIKKPEEPAYAYFPENKEELESLLEKLIAERGNNADLNDIDVSKVVNMQ